ATPASSATTSAKQPKKGTKGRAATKASLLRPRRRLRRGLHLGRLRVQLRQCQQPANRGDKLMRRRRRSPLRSRCSRSRRSTRIFVRSQNRNRFRQLPTTRTIGFKEVISGRVRSMKYSARIVRNGTTRVGIGRVTTGQRCSV